VSLEEAGVSLSSYPELHEEHATAAVAVLKVHYEHPAEHL